MADITSVKETRSLLMRNAVGQETASVDCHSDIKMLDSVDIGIHLCDSYLDTTLWVVGTFFCPRLLYECHTSMTCYTSLETMPRLYPRLLEVTSVKTCLQSDGRSVAQLLFNVCYVSLRWSASLTMS